MNSCNFTLCLAHRPPHGATEEIHPLVHLIVIGLSDLLALKRDLLGIPRVTTRTDEVATTGTRGGHGGIISPEVEGLDTMTEVEKKKRAGVDHERLQ